MRPSTAVLGAAAGLTLAVGVTGTALAAAPTPTTAPASPAAVFVSSPTAVPGQTVHVDGTCALPASGPMPTVVSVTSPAFTGPEAFTKTDPDAFDGTATVRSSAAAGSYTVTLTCSNGTAATSLRVLPAGGGSGAVTPAPVAPSAAPPVTPGNAPAAQPASEDHSGDESLAFGLTAVAVVAAGAAGYVAVSRRRSRTGRHHEHAGV